MPLPNPSTTWKLLRWLVREGTIVIPAAVGYLADSLDQNEQAPALSWMRWVTVAQRTTPAGTSEDRIQFKLDLLNITGGAVDTTWTAGDFTTVKNAFDTYLTTLKPFTSASITFVQYRAYEMAFNPADPGPGLRSKTAGFAFAQTGPPRYVLDFSNPGTGTAGLPYQTAQSVTLRTGWPRHWGRMYLPTPQANAIDTNGRLGSANRTALANGTRALASTLSDAEFLPMVPVTDLNRSAFHACLGINSYVVDDVPDVVRRRRPRQAAFRTVGV